MTTYLIYRDGIWMAVSKRSKRRYKKFDGIKMRGVFFGVTDYTRYYIEHHANPETKKLLLRSVLLRRLKEISQKIDTLDDERKELEFALSMLKNETTK